MSLEADWFLRAHPEITTVEALLPDCNGVMRGKWIPSQKLQKVYDGEFKLPRGTLSLDIWGRDVQSLVFATGDADGICLPIEGSLQPTPWSPGGEHGQVLLSMFTPDGLPYAGDPAHVLAEVVQRFADRGWRPVVAAELEFSLVTWDNNRPAHTCPSPDGSEPLGGNAYDTTVLYRHREMLEEIRVACELQQLPFDGLVKESAPSQYEINMQHCDDPLLAARQVLMMKRLIKGIARKHGLVASFMAKPFMEESGNGMHVHCSVIDEQGLNIFDDGTEKGTPALQQAIGGCLTYMADSVAVFAPNHNSYRRFQSGSLAPTSPCWGYENRTVAVRVPDSAPRARRLEHRLAGADANPYLLFAVILAGVLEGIDENLSPGEPVEGDGYASDSADNRATSEPEAPLPLYLPEALRLFRESDFIRNSLGEEFQRIFTHSKEQEIAEFRRRISELEYQSFLERL